MDDEALLKQEHGGAAMNNSARPLRALPRAFVLQ